MGVGWRIGAIVAACLLAGRGVFAQVPPAPVSEVMRIHVTPGADHLEIYNWRIYLTFRIEGRLVRFLVDTGSARSTISSQISQDWLDGKTYEIKKLGYSPGPGIITQRTRDVALELPGITCNTSFDVDDVVGEKVQVDGVLGRDILSHFWVTIDYGSQTIKFTKPGLESAPTSPIATGSLFGLGIFVPLSVTDQNGAVHEGEGLVDTGNIMALVVWDHSVALKPSGSRVGLGINGGAGVQTAFLPKLTVGGIERKSMPVANGLWDKEQIDQLIASKAIPQDTMGGVGGTVLQNFRLTLDLPEGKVYLEPASAPVPATTSDEEPPTPYPHTEENEQWHGSFLGWRRTALKEDTRAIDAAGAAGVVALSYAYGRGVTQDYGLMLSWARRAAEQGDARGEYVLGLANLYGYAGEKSDLAMARSWFEKSAAQGFPDSDFMMGVCTEHGLGGPDDLKAAIDWYQKAATGQMAAVKQNDRTTHNALDAQEAIERVQAQLSAGK